MQLAQEAAHAKMARDLSNEVFLRDLSFFFQLDEVDLHLEELWEMVVKKCRLAVMCFVKNVLKNLSYMLAYTCFCSYEFACMFYCSRKHVIFYLNLNALLTITRFKC